MEDKKVLIRIDSGDHNGSSQVGVNGAFVRVPHNVNFPIHPDYLDALNNSNVSYKIVGGSAPASGAEGEGALPSAPVNDDALVSEAEANRLAGEQTKVVEAAEILNSSEVLENNGDQAPQELRQGSTAHDGMTDEQKAAEPTTTPEPDLDKQDETPAKDETPAAEADEGDGDLDGKPFVAADVLSGSIAKISENMDEFTPRQLRALVAAEEKGANRSTLIEALTKKIG